MLSVKQTDDQYWVFVLAGHMLQKWFMSADEQEQLLYCTELGRVIRDAFQCTAWESCGTEQVQIEIWLLDIQVKYFYTVIRYMRLYFTDIYFICVF